MVKLLILLVLWFPEILFGECKEEMVEVRPSIFGGVYTHWIETCDDYSNCLIRCVSYFQEKSHFGKSDTQFLGGAHTSSVTGLDAHLSNILSICKDLKINKCTIQTTFPDKNFIKFSAN